MTSSISATDCPACGYHYAATFLNDTMPLATIAWPATEHEALTMQNLHLDFVQCLQCSHVYNKSFKYEDVPYSDKPNLMFNNGAIWSGFIQDVIDNLAKNLPENPTIIEIGHGDGSFLSALSQHCKTGRFIGFDPNGAAAGDDHLTFKQELFMPLTHVAEYKPDLIIMRHIVEHLSDPLAFLQSFALAAAVENHNMRFYIETPCIDNVLTSNRTVDFYYEHTNQFTTKSFTAMLNTAGFSCKEISHGYAREVIYTHADLTPNQDLKATLSGAGHFRTITEKAIPHIKQQIKNYKTQGHSLAIWGGTGKSAAFMNRYKINKDVIDYVIDSDPRKAGTFVPGTAQQIYTVDRLLEKPVDIIIIPPQWRAKDITIEMQERGVTAQKVLVEHDGALIEYDHFISLT